MNKIFVIGFPKCGTTSIHDSLLNAGIKSSHWQIPAKDNFEVNKSGPRQVSPIGCLIKKAKQEGNKLLYYLNGYEAFTQMDANFLYKNNSKLFCYYPQLEDVPTFDIEYPNSRFIFNDRKISNWIRSLINWAPNKKSKLNYKDVIKISDIPGLPRGKGDDEDLKRWYLWHKNNMIDYFKHKDNFLVFNIEKDPAQKLGDFLEIKNFVFLHSNKTKII